MTVCVLLGYDSQQTNITLGDNMKLKPLSISILFIIASLAACDKSTQQTSNVSAAKTGTQQEAEVETMTPPRSVEERRELREQLAEQQAKTLPEPAAEEPEESDLPRGEVPNAIFEKIINTLLANTGATRDEVTVRLAQSVTYNDGSLGCGRPGQNYTMAIVPGYRVILVYDGQQFDYRATEKGFFMLCERPSLSPPGGNSKPPVM